MLTLSRSTGRPSEKALHAIDQLDDAVGLLADQPGQGAIRIIGLCFEKLGGAPYAGQRILDFMRQHRGHGGDRTRAAAVGELPVHFFGQRALLQHDDDAVLKFWQGRHENIDELIRRAGPAEAEFDAVAVEGGAGRLDLFDEIEQR